MITLNEARIGNFTSSEIVALLTLGKDKVSFGKPALTYIAEANMERKLGRSLTSEIGARPTVWGSVLEKVVFKKLGIAYTPLGDETIVHPTHEFWAGSPDAAKENTVVEIKCPFTLKSFCLLADAVEDENPIQSIRDNHPDGEKYYWQIVSNAIITDSSFAELVIYCPYQRELAEIREMVSNYDGNQNKIAWIAFAEDEDLPYLVNDGYYKNLNIIRFEVPQSDKDFLTQRIQAAGKLLVS